MTREYVAFDKGQAAGDLFAGVSVNESVCVLSLFVS